MGSIPTSSESTPNPNLSTTNALTVSISAFFTSDRFPPTRAMEALEITVVIGETLAVA